MKKLLLVVGIAICSNSGEAQTSVKKESKDWTGTTQGVDTVQLNLETLYMKKPIDKKGYIIIEVCDYECILEGKKRNKCITYYYKKEDE